MSDDPRAPRQERSRKTLERLLSATAEMLEAHGLEGATVPRIAARAGVAPASIYRRFEDKDALYRAAFLNLLETSVEASRLNLQPERFRHLSLEEAVERVLDALVRQYRGHPGLLRALNRFLERQAEKEFALRAFALIRVNLARLVEILLCYRERIAHPDPNFAVAFGLLSAVTVIEAQLLEQSSLWHEALPLPDERIKAELARSLVAFLQAK